MKNAMTRQQKLREAMRIYREKERLLEMPKRKRPGSGELDSRFAVEIVGTLEDAFKTIKRCVDMIESSSADVYDNMADDQVDCVGDIKDVYDKLSDLTARARTVFLGDDDEVEQPEPTRKSRRRRF